MAELTKDERSLLLYLEARAVDHGGLVAATHMNEEDFAIANRWNREGFIRFSRIPTNLWDKIVGSSSREMPPRHVVEFTGASWAAVSKERRLRAERIQRADIVPASLAHFEELNRSGVTA